VACVGALLGCQGSEPPAPLAATQPGPATSPAASRRPLAPPAESANAPDAPPLARPITRVLVLGDSLSDEKVGGGGFVRSLRQRCPAATFDNRAKGGFMVNQIRKRLEREVLPEGQRYSHAIVFGGVNDLYSDQSAGRTLAKIESDLSRIYEQLEARGTAVVAVTVTPWGDFKRWFTPERGQNTLSLNRWIAARADVTPVDAYPLLSCGEPHKLCPELAAPHKDGLHFGKAGHDKLAQALLEGPFRACGAD
jgi:lysophospholipase L1-like esterase